jgi:hypothetical protein
MNFELTTLEREMENGRKANTSCCIFQQLEASTSYTSMSSTSERHL